ncbi:PQQ-dependent sugar dehydrogenase [Cognatishimia sp.]|uniref:PQQ-dependent sugar dehydrogenase n=1 Tax=Cognatishimia sp. TaxID=2211648 RepID=UPI0035171A43
MSHQQRPEISRWMSILVLALAFATFSAFPAALSAQSGGGFLDVTRQYKGLKGAWGFDFLPDGNLVITEKRGRMYVSDGSRLTRLSGLPNIHVDGQGGLLDVTVAKDFESSQEIFFTFVAKQASGSGTAAAVARLDTENARLENVRVVFEMAEGSQGGRHFGSRIAEAADGTLFITLGDRGDRPSAQDLSNHNGSIVRINRDGSIPSDNPFTSGPTPEIWSYGHRNPQGLDISESGTVWAVEHGAKGGDEVNLVARGNNYGWPVISYGVHYSGRSIGEGTTKDGMEQPEFFWDPSIAPSGLMVYEGAMFPEWQGDVFVGSLKFDYISRLSGSPLREVQQIELSETRRVRDVAEGPDGSIWFISEDRNAIYRLAR